MPIFNCSIVSELHSFLMNEDLRPMGISNGHFLKKSHPVFVMTLRQQLPNGMVVSVYLRFKYLK